jgi:chromosomal replication initiator protein
MSQSYLDEITDIWKMVRDSFHNHLSRETVDLWFGELTVTNFEHNTITLSTNSEFKLNVIKNRHLEDIKKGFCNLLGFDIDVEIVFGGQRSDFRQVIETLEKAKEAHSQATEQREKDPVPPIQNHALTSGYHFEYTFDNFIIGASNKFAHAACVAVADRPAMNYNPLFIYGQSGLGKTHLMYAIINELKRNNPDINIIYVKGDDFTNQLVESLKSNAPHQFREKYRKCDVLLIDDIQFIAGKESTQEEFFHTFNSLFEEHKQIILTSDRPPRDIKTLEDRLRTRFEWGLIADIQPPDLELRIAIIKKKAEQVNIHLPDDVLMFLAENLRSNIRQIEGAIKKLGALIFLSGKELNMDLAKSCISELLGGAEPVSVTVDKIFASIFKKYGVKKEDIIGSRRTKDVAWARHVSVYLIRAITDMSFPNIGKILGRDHSTIMSSIDAIERKIQADNMFSLELEEMKKEITGQ